MEKITPKCVSGEDLFGYTQGKAASTLFFVCACGNYVGIKHGKKIPSGNIPTHEMRNVTSLTQAKIRLIIDLKLASYSQCSGSITKRLGFTYRSGGLRTLQQAQLSLVAVNLMIGEMPEKHKNTVLRRLQGLECGIDDCRIDVFCCGCNRVTKVRLTNGCEVYGVATGKLATEPYWI
ncbi:hypothetical protein LMH73_016620, partial [Vibrio splendidus]